MTAITKLNARIKEMYEEGEVNLHLGDHIDGSPISEILAETLPYLIEDIVKPKGGS